MKDFENKKLEAIEAINFLKSHPAVSPEIFSANICEGIDFWMNPVCKNGYSDYVKHSGVSVYIDSQWGEKYKDLLIKRWEEDGIVDPDMQRFSSVDIPYEEIFGEPWTFDHVEYWWEITFFVFAGNPYDRTDLYEHKKWQRYAGCYKGKEGASETFEDMIINAAKCVKEEYGDFGNWQDFYTPEEIKNHKEERPFGDFKPIGNGMSEVIFNDRHVQIGRGLINLRWLKWYIDFKTEPVILEDWGQDTLNEWKSYISKIENLFPEERKKILNIN